MADSREKFEKVLELNRNLKENLEMEKAEVRPDLENSVVRIMKPYMIGLAAFVVLVLVSAFIGIPLRYVMPLIISVSAVWLVSLIVLLVIAFSKYKTDLAYYERNLGRRVKEDEAFRTRLFKHYDRVLDDVMKSE